MVLAGQSRCIVPISFRSRYNCAFHPSQGRIVDRSATKSVIKFTSEQSVYVFSTGSTFRRPLSFNPTIIYIAASCKLQQDPAVLVERRRGRTETASLPQFPLVPLKPNRIPILRMSADMDARTRSALIKQAESLVKQHMQAYDPSHDWFHGKSCQPLT